MTIKVVKHNGNNVDEMQDELDRLLEIYAETGNPDTEKQLIKLYEKMSNFKSGCGVCIAGRNQFIKGLRQVKEGDMLEALNSMKASMTSVKVKWHILTKRWLG